MFEYLRDHHIVMATPFMLSFFTWITSAPALWASLSGASATAFYLYSLYKLYKKK